MDALVGVFRSALSAGHGGPPPDLAQLFAAWVRHAFRVASDADGLAFLRLLVRVLDDADADAAATVRGRIEDAAEAFVDTMTLLHPGANRRAVSMAYVCAMAALLKYATSPARVALLVSASGAEDGPLPVVPVSATETPATRVSSDAVEDSDPAEEARLVRFLVGGVEAALTA